MAAPALPEERLQRLAANILREMDVAVQTAAEIGPEWENVVDDIRVPLVDQLEALCRRLETRLKLADQLNDAPRHRGTGE